jgi:hypothetical protein
MDYFGDAHAFDLEPWTEDEAVLQEGGGHGFDVVRVTKSRSAGVAFLTRLSAAHASSL